MDTLPIHKEILNEINRLYNEQHINVCVGCEYEKYASCDISDNSPRLCCCKQQIAKYTNK